MVNGSSDAQRLEAAKIDSVDELGLKAPTINELVHSRTDDKHFGGV